MNKKINGFLRSAVKNQKKGLKMELQKYIGQEVKNLTVWERLAADCVRQLKENPGQIAVSHDNPTGVSVFGRLDADQRGVVHVIDNTLSSGFYRDFIRGNIRYRIESGNKEIV